jgi:glycosyltransferase involved in cell wall biosynthesis
MQNHSRPGDPAAVSVIDFEGSAIGACQHLRLTGPFGWLERHQGWAPLEYALKQGAPPSRRVRQVARLNRLTLGCAFPSAHVQATLAGVREGVTLTPAANAEALLVLRELAPEFVEEAARLARQRRIPLVYDTDDHLLAVPEDSPVFSHYEALRLWLTRWIRQADHVTVANAVLAAEVAELNPSVSILPSFMDADLWGVTDVPIAGERPVSIGFWGTASHAPDLRRLTAGFRHLKARYGRRIRFQFMGCHDPELLSLDDVTVGAHVPTYAAYARATRNCPLDIALAPLKVNLFNRCKSPIKFFEYSIRGACGVYADLDPYQSVVRDGENGLLVGPDPADWIAALQALIEDPDARSRMAQQAQADVLAHHTLDRHAEKWAAVYGSLIATRSTRRRSLLRPLPGANDTRVLAAR